MGRRRPTVYSSRLVWPEIQAALRDAGMDPAAVDWWAATLDGTMIVPGAVAVQFQETAGYDLSVILDPGWIGAPLPPPAVSAPLGGSSDMTIALAPRPGGGVDSFDIAARDGAVLWSGDVPDYQEGAPVALPVLPGGAAPHAVAATWDSPTRLVCDVLDAAGVRHRNVLDISGGWADAAWGSWAQVGTNILVPAVVAPGTSVAPHQHSVTASGTTGGPV